MAPTSAAITLRETPAPFHLFVAFEPTSISGQALVRVSAAPLSPPGRLAAPPIVKFTLSGSTDAQLVALQFESSTRSYVGLLDGLPVDGDGILEVAATDASQRTVTRLEAVSMASVGPGATTSVFSADGALSVNVPEGGLPVGARVAIGPSPVQPPPLPPGFALVFEPLDVAASTGRTLSVPGTLRFSLPRSGDPAGATGFEPQAFKILRFNPATATWDNLGSGVYLPSPIEKVTLPSQQLGVFALIGRPTPPAAGEGPDVSHAVPTVALLWPPDHRLVSVGIAGVIPAVGTTVSIAITRITSDEPSQDKEPGEQCPDAVIDGSSVRLRAERSSRGNGRVYSIYFTASDGTGASRPGYVRVCVPLDQGERSDCVDDGAGLDPTRCSR